MNEELEKALSNPTVDVPTAGKLMGLGINGSYEAAKKGEIKVIRVGHRLRVPTAWLRRVLEIDGEAA